MSNPAVAATREASRSNPWPWTAIITAVAIGVYALLRWLPMAGDALHYSDFGAGERGFLEFCEPGSPQFAPVDRVRSPVTLELEPATTLEAGREARVRARLATASGKPIGEEDLLVVHTRKMHLLVIDTSLGDYHHVHPVATDVAGEFAFSFVPAHAGRYRVFADFMPRATGRSLYAGGELVVHGEPPPAPEPRRERLSANVGDVEFRLEVDEGPLRLNQTANLILTIGRRDGEPVQLEDVMDAPAHVVAFDAACSGFAHLHPGPPSPEIAQRTDAGRRLVFTINVPDPGFYRLWAQLRIAGKDIYVPFDLQAVP